MGTIMRVIWEDRSKQDRGFCYCFLIIYVMINSQSMSLSQKQKFWRQHKQDTFKNMAGDNCAMFNYFFNNNDLFGYIEDKDFKLYSLYLLKTMDLQANIFIGSIATVLVTDRFILNRYLPKLRFTEWRLTANLLKFIVWPFCLFKVVDYFYLRPYREEMFDIQNKYHFGFADYLKGNRIFQRALAVNRLEQLLEKREQFDWTDVPQLKA